MTHEIQEGYFYKNSPFFQWTKENGNSLYDLISCYSLKKKYFLNFIFYQEKFIFIHKKILMSL